MAGFILPIISGLAGLFGGGKQSTTNTNTNQSSQMQQSGQGNYNTFGSTTPNLNPFQQQLAQQFSLAAGKNLTNTTNLNPYATAGLGQISNQGQLNTQAISNALAARGLQYSPVAGNALAQNTINSGNQANQFLQQIPLLQQQLSQQAIQQAMAAFATQPYGVSQTGGGTSFNESQSYGSTHGTGSSSVYGDPLAGLFGGLGAGLAAPGPGGSSNLGAILKSLGLGG